MTTDTCVASSAGVITNISYDEAIRLARLRARGRSTRQQVYALIPGVWFVQDADESKIRLQRAS